MDEDFRRSRRESGTPAALLAVRTGNLRRNPLLTLFEVHLPALIAALESDGYAELTLDGPLTR